MIFRAVISVVTAYLIGSISFALLVGKLFYQKDIRQHGSGNLGATNTIRILGWLPGITVLIFDVLKGFSAVMLAGWLMKGEPVSTVDLIKILSGLAVIVGHNWSIYLKFSGGRGVLTAAGVILALFWQITLIELMIFLIILALFRYVSLSSILIALCFPFLVMYFHPGNYAYIVFAFVAAAMVIWKHQPNIKRILRGEEPRVGKIRTRSIKD